jgi:hypothetical protein
VSGGFTKTILEPLFILAFVLVTAHWLLTA